MSSVLADARTGHAGARRGGAGDRWRALAALARVEAVRLPRHPVTIVAVVLFIGPWLYGWISGGANRFPILPDEDRGMQFSALFLLGGAALVVANLMALRAHRHGTAPIYDVLVLPDHWRSGAHLLALVPLGLLAAALVALRIGVLAALPGAAGRPNPYELAVTPAVVVLLGAVGVLLARLVRSAIVAPLVLLGLGVLTYASLLAPPGSDGRLPWLLPVAVPNDPMPLPADLMALPAGRHLAYLVGATAIVAAVTLARTGARGRRLTVVTAAGLAVAVGAGAAQFIPAGDAVTAARKAATERPAERQTCRRIEQVTYCAFADFTPWIGAWDAVVRGVLRRLPDAQAHLPLAVRQRVFAYGYPTSSSWTETAEERDARQQARQRTDLAAGTPNAVTVGTVWGDARSELGFAGLVAYAVITRQGPIGNGVVCGARGVLLGWLAVQSTPRAAVGLREARASGSSDMSFYDPSFHLGVSVVDRERSMALALLARPADEVAATVRRSWAELSAAETSTERAGEIFGIAVPPQLPENERSVCAE